MTIGLLTDTHFGVRSSSSIWFRSAERFVRDQFIPKMKERSPEYIFHLGDVFDTRQSINTYIATETRELFKEISKVAPVYIIPGNHDYYSEQTSHYCSPELILGDLENVEVVTSTKEMGNLVLIPWPDQKEGIEELTNKYNGRYIFTHTDLITDSPTLKTPVFSGHLHTPFIRGNCRNLGSCFPLTFADCNRGRNFYIWDKDKDELETFVNEKSIRFWRWTNEEILRDLPEKVRGEDYIALCIDRNNFLRVEYKDRIKFFKDTFKNLWIIPQSEDRKVQNTSEGTNLEDIINSKVPNNLKMRLEEVKKRIL